MHHYGETGVEVKFYRHKGEESFNIVIKNQLTNAEITVSGPTKGVFEREEFMLDHVGAERLGNEIAHLLNRVLTIIPEAGSIGDLGVEI